MRPPYNPLPYNSSQIQTNGTTASAVQQVMPNNPFQSNSSNLTQVPQIANPLNNSNTHLFNGSVTIPNRPILTTSFMNQPFPLQNAIHSLGQFPNGFNLQNFNPIAMNQVNSSQPNGQFFSQSLMNVTPYYNQNVGFPGGQFCIQSPLQNMNQFVQMQMPNYAQVVPGNFPMFQNQITQGMGPQNPNFLVNQQFGVVNSNGPVQAVKQEQQRFISPIMDVNASNQLHIPNNGQQLQGNSSLQSASGSVQPQQAQNSLPGITRSQGNPVMSNGPNNVNSKWKTNQSRNFTRHKKNEASKLGFKSQSDHTQNVKGKFRLRDEHWKKGYHNDGATKAGLANSTIQIRVEKKLLALSYSDQEIQQWRQDRKKNYPSKANVEKKLTEKQTLPEVTDQYAKFRRQQLKEILAKQAELGCEVAEIPVDYFSESEKQGCGGEENDRECNKKGRFQNKLQKRGRLRQNNRFAKKRRSGDHDENNGFTKKQRFTTNEKSTMQREPTLLQKLLTADLRRDKSHLLQVFSFMVMNSFFKEWPEKSLGFPSVVVKETGGEGEVTEEKASLVENEDNGETDAHCIIGNISREECTSVEKVEGLEEEEGEIVD